MPSEPAGQHGQSMVEFALVLPLWLLILAVVFAVAWLGYLQISLERAVFEGAKVGAVFTDNRIAIAQARVQDIMGPVELPEPAGVNVVNDPFPQGKITVTAKYDWTAPSAFGFPTFQLQARAIATLEQ